MVWDCKWAKFVYKQQSYGLGLMYKCVFPQYQNKWMNFDKNFVYALINTRSIFYLMHNIFGQFLTELWPLIDVRNLFMLNIL